MLIQNRRPQRAWQWSARRQRVKWKNQERSSNVEHRRRGSIDATGCGGGSIGLGSVVVARVAGLIFGSNPPTLLGMMADDDGSARQVQQSPAAYPPAGGREVPFVSTALCDTEVFWGGLPQSDQFGSAKFISRHQHG